MKNLLLFLIGCFFYSHVCGQSTIENSNLPQGVFKVEAERSPEDIAKKKQHDAEILNSTNENVELPAGVFKIEEEPSAEEIQRREQEKNKTIPRN